MSLKKIWINKWKILAGLWNNIFRKINTERVFQERLAICGKCPKLDLAGSKCAVPGTAPCCGVCGCSLDILLRSMDAECEDGKWKAVTKVEDGE